jgi:autotransporter-associated beta strand protein
MTTFSGVQYDTLVLDGTSAGNTIYGAITDAPNSLGVGFGDTRITKSNSSQWVLAGTNTFSGPTVITGGTLQLGTGRSGQDGTLYSAANINSVSNNAALVYDIVGNQTALYSIGGSGALSMIGPGSVTLAASNSYTGATNISRGTLTVGPAGSIAQSPTIFLSGGATFDVSQVYFQLAAGQSLAGTGNYTVNGAMTADSGATIQPGASASAGTLNVGGLTLSPGSSLSYDLGLGRGQNLINVGSAFGGLTLNGGGVALTQPNGSTFGTPGTYLLMNYGSGNSVAGSPSNLSVLNPTASNTYSFTATGGSLDVTIGAPNVWNGGANPSFVWSKASNWSTGQAPANNNSIMFAGTTGLSNINDIGGLGLTAVFFSPSAGAFNISGNPIQLGGPIINSSTAAQTIGLNITLTGGTQNVNAAAGNIVLNGVIDDAGAGLGINIIGPHTVILGGANTYSGTTSAAGPLRLANPLALQNSTLNLLPGGSLTFAASSTSVSIAGLGGNGSIALTTSTGQPVALGVGGTNLSSIFGGTLSGNGSLIKQGNGTFTLAAPQTYGGATLVTGGVLQLVPAIAIAGFGANTTGATFTGDNGAWQFNSNGAAYTATPVTGGVLTLTQSTVGNSARSAFYNNPAPVQAFNASFVYKDASVNGADGVTFMLQSQGLTALGYPGGAWGYTGATLTSPGITSSVGISMNIYSGAPGGSSSVNLLEGGIVTSTAGISTSPVNIDDGDPISVSLSYDGFNNLTLSLSDTTAGTSYTKTFAGVNFAALIGSNNAYVGFSGADGGVNSTQLISNFSFKSPPNGGGGLPSNSPVTISNGSTLDMTNYQQTILSLSSTDGMGSQVLLGNGALTIANTAAGTTFDGTIAGAGGTLIVQGGKFTLTGPNTYSGVTEIVGGGTLQLATGPTGQDGSIDTTSLVSDFGTVVYNVADNRTIAYPVTGPGSLVQAGTGVLTLTATNSYIGATTIGGGTLQLGAGMAGEDGSIAGARVIDNGTLVYNLYGGESPAYVISGSGSLVLTGGTLTLSGTNSYSGGTIVESGMLVLSDNAAIADGTSLAVGDPAFFFGPAAAAGGGSAAPLTESQAATVPEPPTLALAAAAGAVLSALFRKHRRR